MHSESKRMPTRLIACLCVCVCVRVCACVCACVLCLSVVFFSLGEEKWLNDMPWLSVSRVWLCCVLWRLLRAASSSEVETRSSRGSKEGLPKLSEEEVCAHTMHASAVVKEAVLLVLFCLLMGKRETERQRGRETKEAMKKWTRVG